MQRFRRCIRYLLVHMVDLSELCHPEAEDHIVQNIHNHLYKSRAEVGGVIGGPQWKESI